MKLTKITPATLFAGISLIAFSGPANADTTPAPPVEKKSEWWPKSVDLIALRQNESRSNPYGSDFDYAKEFASLDLDAVKADIRKVLTTSQPWWPADYGHYGPFFIRMAWHSAGTYRTGDGRGGADGGEQRFEPLNSWPDNISLDKARRLVWPIKQKYGRKLSWGDLMVLAGNVAMEDMGFQTLGFAGGRIDAWQPDLVFWGPETGMLMDQRRDEKGNLKGPLAATQMGLIYVNPEGPNGVPDPLAAAADIRRAFGAMAMSDDETAALIAGGHTFGKAHGAHKPKECVSADPGMAKMEQQGLGWSNKCGKGNADDTVSSGLEGAWTSNPIAFTTQYLDNLYGFEWVKSKSPAGAVQWIPKDPDASNMVPDAHRPDIRHGPIMFTTDLALREDPGFRKVTMAWQKKPEEFSKAFARAWFKLTHRDMGPQARYVGKGSPTVTFTWQDPLPKAASVQINSDDIALLKGRLLNSGLSNAELVRTAWAAASTFRMTDMRGGANGARVQLEPQRNWEANNPLQLAKSLSVLDKIRQDFNKTSNGRDISLSDLIVLGGNAAIEQAAKNAGSNLNMPFTPGRVDATQAETDVESFNYLRPKADGFRNYFSADSDNGPVEALIDKADMLNLTVPEMTVLIGGLRVLNANFDGSKSGVFTQQPGKLTTDYFTNLLSMDTVWTKNPELGLYEGKDRTTGQPKWTATPVDLVFGSSSELRAVAEVYASDDAKQKFVNDFAAAWTKVMNADRF